MGNDSVWSVERKISPPDMQSGHGTRHGVHRQHLLVHPLHLVPGFDGETSEHGIWKLLPA
jgi:hypothetical protein